MSDTKHPPAWDEQRVQHVLQHYETQPDDEAVAEDEESYESITHTTMSVPVELVEAVRELIAQRKAE